MTPEHMHTDAANAEVFRDTGDDSVLLSRLRVGLRTMHRGGCRRDHGVSVSRRAVGMAEDEERSLRETFTNPDTGEIKFGDLVTWMIAHIRSIDPNLVYCVKQM